MNDVAEPSVKLFEGERWLILTGLFGIVLAVFTAVVIYFQGPIVLPEGNLESAFSFNAAVGIYILSIAAILPLAKLTVRKRKVIRRLFIVSSLYSYGIESIQHLRGLNPRFSVEGSLVDMIAGMLFGVISLLLVILALVLTIQFFRIKSPYERPLIILGIRYAFFSILVGNLAGIWMIVLQGRFTGDMGNLIVLHGIGFHALQTLILPAWFLENSQVKDRLKKTLIHYGSIAWIVSIILIGFQTALGRTVFELSALPILTGIVLFIWLGATIMSFVLFVRKEKIKRALFN
ncbi:hypothetical protein [Salicibibacter kimchii]|uniref:hypothetical protein n=1 Tax=Salicibibacter kimchii TaxID=2099786 RepID=UPI001D048AAA|nr:hypothetical protein [Salicibibacter kimchii]